MSEIDAETDLRQGDVVFGCGAKPLENVRVSCYCVEKATIAGRAGRKMRILGIDPGLRILGWGVIESNGSRLAHVANGLCKSSGEDLGARLLSLHSQLVEVLARFCPDQAAIEQTFVNKDGAGTLKLGQARGVALLAAAQAGLPIGEYAPNRVKKTVVGVGHADKRQVLHMVRLQLPGCDPAGPDAADALAIAICHAHFGGVAGPQLREVRA
jgi:crossover junction endodeoxyribonuclease RuvC